MQYIKFISYTYLFITFIFILFYIILFSKEKITKQKNKKKKELLKEQITKEIENNKKKNMFSKKHIDFLKKELLQINNLLLFEEVLTSLEKKEKEEVNQYCTQIKEVFTFLIQKYRSKNSVEKAYFTYLLSKFPILMDNNDHLIDYAMMHFVFDPSVYCRENAMLFFYEKGTPQQIINSLKKISNRNLYYSAKLLADDLLKFKGSHKELSTLLLEEFNEFSISFQIAIIHYIRLAGEDKKEDLYQKLLSKKYDKEVNLAIIRYFARYKYDKVLKELLNFMQDKNKYDFEYRIVTAFTLATYDEKEVRKALIESLKDRNWYVRKNAAHSLSKMEITIEELKKALLVEDAYAKEMLQNIWKEKQKTKGWDTYAINNCL